MKNTDSTENLQPPDLPPSPWRHLPNALAFMRIATIPLIYLFSLQQEYTWAFVVFTVAALSDYVDGVLVRRYHWHSRFGMILDPVADILFIFCLIPLLWHLDSIGPLFTILVVLRCGVQLSVVPVMMWWLRRPFTVRLKWLQHLATVVAFLILGFGFARQLTFEFTPEYVWMEAVFDRTLAALTAIGCLLEVAVLVRFLPRYWQILQGKRYIIE